MPCPASYEEQRLVALDGESAFLARNVEAQFGQIPDTLHLLRRFEQVLLPEAVRAELASLGIALERLAAEAHTTQYTFNGFGSEWPTMEVVQRYEAFVDGLRRMHYALESTLCQSRMLMYVHEDLMWGSLPEDGTQPLREIWKREMDRHAIHREEDRAAVLLPLERSLQYYQGRLLENLSPTQRESAEAYVLEFTAKIEDVKGIPITTLMADRCKL